MKTANWMNHLEYDWESPIWRHVFRGLSRGHTLIRYDPRGNGMSDWEVDELSLDAWVSDLETIVDAAGLERFPLLGISQGGANLSCLCGAQPRTGNAPYTLRSVCAWRKTAFSGRERKAQCDASLDAERMGSG